MVNPESTILSQYASSPIITTLLNDWNTDIDPRLDFRDFYLYVWNITTAIGYGLDVWGRIVGAPRSYITQQSYDFFGFNEAGYAQFDSEPFYNGAPSSIETITLDDNTYRQVILAKALADCSNCSATTMNQSLQSLFADRGVSYVIDNLDGSYTLRMKFTLTTQDRAILTQSGVFPRPAGVSYTIVEGA